MSVEECCDSPVCVLFGSLVVGDPDDLQDAEQGVVVVDEERVPGVGILLDVVLDGGLLMIGQAPASSALSPWVPRRS